MGKDMVKPSRSDEVLEPDQAQRITDQTRSHFDSIGPKRPIKPNRSEIESTPPTQQLDQDHTIPELDKLQSLRSQSQPIFLEEGAMVQDEFVETQYYVELNSIDKQHHKTGTGFIRVPESTGDEYRLQLEREEREREMNFRSNPATNDWDPKMGKTNTMGKDMVKPSRSDEVLDPDQAQRITDQIRSHFDSIGPKRPIKPNRSEMDSTPPTLQLDHDHTIPELDKLQSLRSQSQPICLEEGAMVQDEFLETQYYVGLNSIDKQHHKTGTGFIRVPESTGDEYRLQLEREGRVREMNFISNPATNDRVPRMGE